MRLISCPRKKCCGFIFVHARVIEYSQYSHLTNHVAAPMRNKWLLKLTQHVTTVQVMLDWLICIWRWRYIDARKKESKNVHTWSVLTNNSDRDRFQLFSLSLIYVSTKAHICKFFFCKIVLYFSWTGSCSLSLRTSVQICVAVIKINLCWHLEQLLGYKNCYILFSF